MGKSTLSMAIFHSYVSHYQRVDMLALPSGRRFSVQTWPFGPLFGPADVLRKTSTGPLFQLRTIETGGWPTPLKNIISMTIPDIWEKNTNQETFSGKPWKTQQCHGWDHASRWNCCKLGVCLDKNPREVAKSKLALFGPFSSKSGHFHIISTCFFFTSGFFTRSGSKKFYLGAQRSF